MLCDEIAIMDHGKIIAQGSPKQLLATHFNDVILQLPETDLTSQLKTANMVHHRNGLVEITTHDINSTIEELMSLNISLTHMQVRSRNLDDLFLELTGKELRN